MEVKYVKPVLIGSPLKVTGGLLDDTDPPLVKAKADIRDDKGSLLVKSIGEFVLLPEEKLTSVPEGLKKDMNSLFELFGEY